MMIELLTYPTIKKDKAVLTDGFVLLLSNVVTGILIILIIKIMSHSIYSGIKTNKAGLTVGLTFIYSCKYIIKNIFNVTI